MSFGVLALIVAAGLAGPVLAMGHRALVPVVVGELAAGVAIGVSGTGWLDPAEPTTAFLADLGFAMLMFAAGMHVPIRTPGIGAGLRRGALAAVAAGLLAVPAGFGAAALIGGGDGIVYALLLASGSAAILLPAVQEAGLMEEPRALTVMSQVAIADVAAIVALPLVVLADGAGRALLGGAVVAAAGLAIFLGARALRGSALVHRVRRASKKRGWALDLRLSLLLLFVLAWVAQRTGTSILVAGFTVGLLVAAVGGPKRLSRQVIGIAAGFFVPLFFVVLGARLDLRAVLEHPSYLVLAALLVVLNVVVHGVAALVSGQRPAAALMATAQLGVPAGVVAIGLAEGVITPGQGGAIILAALASIGLCTLGVDLLARDRPAPDAPPPVARPGAVSRRGGGGPPSPA